MNILQVKKISAPAQCHYLPDKKWQFEYFFATDLDKHELNTLLESGWRKFGYYYFKPSCENCIKCLPLRVKASEFIPTKSQRRIIKKNREIKVKFTPLTYSEKIFEIYQNHSINRFGKVDNNKNDFISSFYTQSCPTLQSMYYLNNELAGVGFIDITHNALSSIYYIFDTAYSNLNLGTYSIIREINQAADIDLDYYYLGYYIEECPSMAYKGHFAPYETYDWDRKEWHSTT